ncbi:MAG: hypothetical protein PHY09_07500 [Desulfuromonadaceae bacterium]|nr:hypothetical protein [Desulfuromonadaceae bacterium]MDD5106769.1 hypothetical protein [Desulfuromonadaceae bacterium]
MNEKTMVKLLLAVSLCIITSCGRGGSNGSSSGTSSTTTTSTSTTTTTASVTTTTILASNVTSGMNACLQPLNRTYSPFELYRYLNTCSEVITVFVCNSATQYQDQFMGFPLSYNEDYIIGSGDSAPLACSGDAISDSRINYPTNPQTLQPIKCTSAGVPETTNFVCKRL